jgi:carbamoyl-phosphate synthase large subunit
VISSENELNAYLTLSKISPDSVLVQEKLVGKEYTVSVVVDKAGRTLAVVPKEIIKKRGITISAVTRYNKEIMDLGIEIQNKMSANGPFNMQLILTEEGIPVIFEINPRYSTTIALTIAAGVDEITMLIEGTTPAKDLAKFKSGLVMSRYYDQLYFEEKKE